MHQVSSCAHHGQIVSIMNEIWLSYGASPASFLSASPSTSSGCLDKGLGFVSESLDLSGKGSELSSESVRRKVPMVK